MEKFPASDPDVLIPEIGEIPFFEPHPIPDRCWKDGLLVRTPNWLGDAVMAIPAMTVLKKMLPETCGLFVLCPAGIAPLFESLPEIADLVVPLKDPHAFLSASERRRVRRLLAGAGILFNNSFRDAFSLRLCGVHPLFGSAARFRSALLEKSFAFPPRLDRTLNKPHQAAKYLSMAYALGAPAWDHVMPEFSELSMPETRPEGLDDFLSSGRILCAACGAAYGGAKRWHGESFVRVCRSWVAGGGRVLLLGSKGERPAAEEILNSLPPGSGMDCAGQTTLHDVIHILKRSAVCLANDSGIMHLAAAAGTPGVAPFGPTDPAATSPLSSSWRLVFRKRECSPCFKRECPFGTKACFDPVTPEKVFALLQSLARKDR